MSEVRPNWRWRSRYLANEASRLERKADDLRREAAELRELSRRIIPADDAAQHS